MEPVKFLKGITSAKYLEKHWLVVDAEPVAGLTVTAAQHTLSTPKASMREAQAVVVFAAVHGTDLKVLA